MAYVTIIAEGGDDGYLGLCRFTEVPATMKYLEGIAELSDRQRKRAELDIARDAIVTAAGPAATFRRRGGVEAWDEPGLIGDRNALTSIAIGMAGSSVGATCLLDKWHAEATELVHEHWPAVCAVAEALQSERVLSGRQVQRLLRLGRN
jgi:hypothetical protein